MRVWESRKRVGSFTFAVPSLEQVAHAREAQSRAIETLLGEEGLACDTEYDEEGEWVGKLVEVEEDFSNPVWWFEREGCEGNESCTCGRSTLLDALSNLHEEETGDAVREHIQTMRGMFDHFWSGQGVIEGGSHEIGEACPLCITVGAPHVWDVYEAASDLAQELGEAVAAHEASLELGEPRYPHDK